MVFCDHVKMILFPHVVAIVWAVSRLLCEAKASAVASIATIPQCGVIAKDWFWVFVSNFWVFWRRFERRNKAHRYVWTWVIEFFEFFLINLSFSVFIFLYFWEEKLKKAFKCDIINCNTGIYNRNNSSKKLKKTLLLQIVSTSLESPVQNHNMLCL